MTRFPFAATVLAVALALTMTPGVVAAEPEGWSPLHSLSGSTYYRDIHSGYRFSPWEPQVAVNRAGVTAVAYQARRTESGSVRPAVAVKDADGIWSRRVFTRGEHRGHSLVGVNRRGRVTAVWQEWVVGGSNRVRWTQRRADGEWTAQRTIRGAAGNIRGFHMAPSGYAVLTFTAGPEGAAYAKVLTPRGKWRPRVRLSGRDVERGVRHISANVDNDGRVTAAFFSVIYYDGETEAYGPLQRRVISPKGRRLRLVTLIERIYESDDFTVTGSPGGSVAIRHYHSTYRGGWEPNYTESSQVFFRLAGQSWRKVDRSSWAAVAVTENGATLAEIHARTGNTTRDLTLSDYVPATDTWSNPRRVTTLAVGAVTPVIAFDLSRSRDTTYLAYADIPADVDRIEGQLVTDVASEVTVSELEGDFVDLAVRDSHAAMLQEVCPADDCGFELAVSTR